jgi:HlyD family secretion protein
MRAQLATARANLETAALRLSYTEVRAPFTGTIVRKLADEGAVLAPATISDFDAGGIVELVDLAALEVEAEVSEDELGKLEPGQPALIFVDALGGVFPAKMGSVRPAIDRSKATATVKVLFDAIPKGALPDMSAKISFLLRPIDEQGLAEEHRLRVPQAAIVDEGGKTSVLTIDEGRLSAAPVEIAERAGGEAVLKAGPPAGTKVALAGGKRLRHGKRVRVEAQSP